jgi:hypothetical protein
MRPSSLRVLPFALVLSAAVAGCVISEQTGNLPQKLPGFGSGYSAPEDVAYHFASGFNWAIVVGRSLLLVVVAAWLYFSVGGVASRAIGVGLLAVAAWLLYQGVTTVVRYQVEVRVDQGLHVSVPPASPVEIPFEAIDTLEISGYEWQRARTSPGFGPGSAPTKLAFTELPDWRTMTIATTDGRRVELDLERLSIEQRQGLLSAIVRYGGLVEEK